MAKTWLEVLLRFALLLAAVGAFAVTPAVADEICYVPGTDPPGFQEIEAIRSGPPPKLLIDDETLNDFSSVQLALALDESGRITCLKAEFGPAPLIPKALALVRQWRFKPYVRNGKAVPIWFDQRVDVRWSSPRPTIRVPFPDIRDQSSLRIRLEMSPGYMGCASYNVEIEGDGTLIYEGDYGRAGRERETVRLAPEVVEALVDRFRKAEFFWLHDSYTGTMQDIAYGWVSIAFDGHKKRVRDDDGRRAGLPAEVGAIEDEIERLGDTRRRLERGCR